MTKPLVLGFCVIVGAELTSLAPRDHRFVLWVSGVAVAFALFYIRRFVGHDATSDTAAAADTAGSSLRSWLNRTQTSIRWSESTRADWDRHLRPVLARRFSAATGQKQAKDPAAFRATGRMLLGPHLWEWVDPNNVAQDGRGEPGPGRAALEEILERLERV
jgi:hypothetical protein